MIFLWSLVTSAVEAARKRQLANFLRSFLAQQQYSEEYEMLVWKTLRSLESSSYNANRLARFASDTQLNSCLVFQNNLLQASLQKFEHLRASEWRFLPALWPTEVDSVYFIVRENFVAKKTSEPVEGEVLPSFLNLDEKCERLAVHRSRTEALYACSLDIFVDVVDAYSEGFLMDDGNPVVELSSVFAPPKDLEKPKFLPEVYRSSLSVSSCQSQKTMPILQQLFWGDQLYDNLRERHSSESALNCESPMRPHIRPTSTRSVRRRHKSTSPSELLLLRDIDTRFVTNFDDFSSLPRYLRQISRPSSVVCSDVPSTSSARSEASTCVVSEDAPSEVVSEAPSTLTTTSTSFSDTIQSVDALDSATLKNEGTMEDLRLIDASDTETVDSGRYLPALKIDPEHVHFAVLAHREKGSTKRIEEIEENKIEDIMPKLEVTLNGSVLEQDIDKFEECSFPTPKVSDLPADVPAIELWTKPPLHDHNGVTRNRRSTSVVANKLPRTSQRRFSAFSNGDILSERHRSVSPSFEYYQNRSLRGFSTSTKVRSRDSTARSRQYTPLRNFMSNEDKRQRAVAKPPSILVYTAGEDRLYSEIRCRLSSLLPADELTVFNISPEAMRRQPWIEPTTACVIVASTKDLDDVAWNKMQTYFNQAGKIIFVCQNKLLANLTSCDTSKQQADVLRIAFGNRNSLEQTNKDFAKFLKKSLKHLSKNAEINETFRSKDFSPCANFTVVFKKDKDTPLLLYMHNNGSHHASALFSDATTEQLIAPNSNLLRDSLASVGIKVCDVKNQDLSKAVLMAEYDNLIDQISGIRFGEQVGTLPKLFLRRSEVVKEEGLPAASTSLLPVEVVSRQTVDAIPSTSKFNVERFFDKLHCKLGKVLVHVPVATTTMDVCNSFCDAVPSLDNVLIVADRQTQGRGRGGNEFLSPDGVAMFTFAFHIPKGTKLAKTLPIIQHVFCVALVDAAHRLSGVEEFPLRIKWPNDFYFNRSHKVGGMLAAVKSRDDGFLVTIGAGINVWNEKPTICLNDMLPDDVERRIETDELIAETLNRFQFWMSSYENDGGEEFRRKYYEYWLHTFEEVFLEDADEKVVIRGLDQYGYLEVRSKQNSNKVFSIGDDGNTFDMMKGLIRHKV